MFLVEINLHFPTLQYVDLELPDNALEEILEAVIGVAAPVDVVVNLFQGQVDGRCHGRQSQFAAVCGQLKKLVLVEILVHVECQRLDHIGQGGKAIAIAVDGSR